MKSTLRIAAIDAALSIEEKLINPKVGLRDVTVNPAGKINTWAHGAVPPRWRDNIIGSYDARASVEMIAEDLLAAPAFVKANA
ncbi:MAG: hypothetical protein HYY97_16090 [Rhodocyclales bacterium]|nr:hypothetical protein [Rhodocyclales bacterium]